VLFDNGGGKDMDGSEVSWSDPAIACRMHLRRYARRRSLGEWDSLILSRPRKKIQSTQCNDDGDWRDERRTSLFAYPLQECCLGNHHLYHWTAAG
jgi:hypothetical protein